MNELSKSVPSESSTNPTYYELSTVIIAASTDGPITVAQNRHVVVDLNGNTINRNRTSSVVDGYVIKVKGDLTIKGTGTITGGMSQDNSAGVYVNGGRFTMEGGTISGNTTLLGSNTNCRAGGVYVDEDGAFTMKDGTISNNTAYSAGGVYVEGGAFTMEGGTISNNNTAENSSSGGGVCLNGGTFTMKGGKISKNKAVSGGGVSVDKGTFTMEGNSTISNNTGTSDGGGVYVYSGTFNMNDGTISGNTANNWGGGVYVAYSDSTFNMTGGVIGGTATDKNTATSGGGVYLFGKPTFKMTGGAISYNAATGGDGGGGVYVSSGTFNLSGKVDISGNTENSGDCDVKLYRSIFDLNVITVKGKLENTTPIGVKASEGDVFTSGFKAIMPDADPADFFESDETGWGVLWNDNKTEAIMAPAATVIFDNNIASDPQTKKQYVRLDTETELRANPFTRPGYCVTTWTTNPDGTGDKYADQGKVKLNGKLILYAQWEQITPASAQAPAPNSLAYTGSAQPLVTAGSVEGGTMEYALGTDSTTPPADGWSTDIPTGTEPGTYYVWYRVIGDQNHKDVDPACVVVSIEAIAPVGSSGSADYTVLASLKTSGKRALKLKWAKVDGAEGYDVFFGECGSGKCDFVTSVNGLSYKFTKLRKGFAYKAFVRAWRTEGGAKVYIGEPSPDVHAIAGGKSNKYTNPKKISVKKKKIKLAVGGKKKIKASLTKVSNRREYLNHTAKKRWFSSDRNVATVNAKGVVTAVGPGSCKIIVMAENGMRASVKVTVK